MFAGLILSANVHAEFVLDWTADNANPTFSGASVVQGDELLTGQTPFVYERVTDPGSGVAYYHMIVGNPDQDFAQEVYIQVAPGSSFQGFGLIGPGSSSSAGTGQPSGNGTDPLGTGVDSLGNPHTSLFTGDATGNPTRIQMREIHNDGEFSMDFTKNVYLEKPTISMDITSTDFQTEFVIDASGILYNDSTTPAAITNTMQLFDPDIPAGSASFNMATDVQNSNVTAGRYTYTSGIGAGGSRGTYTYAADAFNLGNIQWADYFDSSLSNPWAYSDNRP